LTTLALAFAALAFAADPNREPTIGDLRSQSVDVHTDTPAEASPEKAMENYRRFLELQKTDPKLRAEAMRRLGDLNLESGQVERMEKELGQIDLMGAEAIRLYTVLLKAYPDYPRNDQVLYQLARAYETTGQPEQALATLDRVVSRYPHSPQIDEVQFRRAAVLREAVPAGAGGLRRGDQARHGVCLLRTEPVQAGLVALQAISQRGESAVLRRGA
jgi:tetratricopeptide (TPR) repeat protein